MKNCLTETGKRNIRAGLKEIVISSAVPNSIRNKAFDIYDSLLMGNNVSREVYFTAMALVERTKIYLKQ